VTCYGRSEARGAKLLARLSRLFQPRSITVFGGGWAENVIAQCHKMGFDGAIWPVHPHRESIAGVVCYPTVDDLPGVPDAAFLGINRDAVIEVTRALAAMGCGGAVCFASGFAESGNHNLQRALIEAAGDMPLLGPNCYGFINYLDGALLWPDQHGGSRCTSGVALISQSSNIAINLGMQARGLPIGYVACVGNQAQTSLTDMTAALLDDDRISAAGLYIEGIDDPISFADMVHTAQQRGKYIVAIKSGKTPSSQIAAGAHTAALAGDAAASSAFLRQCGVIEVDSLEDLIETLKLLHVFGPLAGNRVSAMCCSGGEAGLLADSAAAYALDWPEIPEPNHARLAACLGPLVHLANPLDYHTFIWGDVAAMTDCFAGMMGAWVDVSCLVIDFPRADRCSVDAWMPAVTALQQAAAKTQTKAVLMASLAEGMPDSIAAMLVAAGIVPLCGFKTGLSALARVAAITPHSVDAKPWTPFAAIPHRPTIVVDEAAAKQVLDDHGIACPKGIVGDDPASLAAKAAHLNAPLALKGLGVLHKSEHGFVALGLDHAALQDRANAMHDATGFLVEEMVAAPVAELLIGVQRDPQYGLCLTIGSGGILAEVLCDVQSVILPADRNTIKNALDALQFAPVLRGFRGRPTADVNAAIDQISAICRLMTDDNNIAAIEINPLIVGPSDGPSGDRAVAADAVIWRYETGTPKGDTS